ncbi:MAG: type II secretion system F family protein [Chromatiaceae bacterium]|nr:type II secretion system F family protein [Chromatiaceae bacterium]HSO79428.1 type II secretion system F family protein [Chromatiaceae bacterium]
MTDKTLIVIAIFVTVAILVLAFASPMVGNDRRSRRLLRARIDALTKTAQAGDQITLARYSYLDRLSRRERWLESQPALKPLIRLLQQAGVAMPAYRLLLGSLGAALAVLILGPFFIASAGVVVAAALGVGVLPFAWLGRRKRQHLAKFEEQLPDGLAMLARTLRAGLPFSQALQIVSQELEGPVGKELGTVFTEINYGGDLRAALMSMQDRVPSVSVMALSTSILIQRETGGNLAESVDRLERLIRQRFRFEREMKTLTASNRASAKIVGLLPLLMAAGMEGMSPGFLSPLTDTETGRTLLYWTIGLLIVGVLWIQRMTRLSV